ncbi:MAG: hypothetical protein AAB647_01055, partial [Patescibacteria group bacterium]
MDYQTLPNRVADGCIVYLGDMVHFVLKVKDEKPDLAQSVFARWLQDGRFYVGWLDFNIFSHSEDPHLHQGATKRHLASWITTWNLRANRLLPFLVSALAEAGYQFSREELADPSIFTLVDTEWPYGSRLEPQSSAIWNREDCIPTIFASGHDLPRIVGSWLARRLELHYWWHGAWKAHDVAAVVRLDEGLRLACAHRPELRTLVLDLAFHGYLPGSSIAIGSWLWTQFQNFLLTPDQFGWFMDEDWAYLRGQAAVAYPPTLHSLRYKFPELAVHLGIGA